MSRAGPASEPSTEERIPRADLVVIGAGVAGLSVAEAAARRGRSVVVLEAGTVGSQGASSVPLALLNPHRGRSARAHGDDLRGLAAFWDRDARLRASGLDTGADRSGVVRLATSARQADRWRDVAMGSDVAAWLEPDAVSPDYRAPFGALLVTGGGTVDPARLLAALTAAVEMHGGHVVERARVTSVTPREANDAAVVVCAEDRRWTTRAAVVCIGADDLPGLPLPDMARLEGDVITLEPVPPARWPVAGGVYGAATGGRARVGGNHRAPPTPSDTASSVDRAEVAASLRDRFARALPGAATARVVAHWTGVRAKRPGHRPLSMRLAPGVWFLGALSGRGFLCSADEADRLLDRLETDG